MDEAQVLQLLNLAVAVGDDIVVAVKAALTLKFGADYVKLEVLWQEDIDRAAKDMQG